MPVLRFPAALLALTLALAPALAGSAAGGSGPGRETAPLSVGNAAPPEDANEARVIVQYKRDSLLMQASAVGAGGRAAPQHAGTLGQRLGLPMQNGRVLGERMQALRGQGLSSRQLAAKLSQQADVEWAVVDEKRYITAAPNDPLYSANASNSPAVGQWYLRAPDAAVSSVDKPVVSSINAEAGWAITTGSPSITVAVLDTGIRTDHPDFVKADGSSKLWPGYDFVSDADVSNRGGATRGPGAADPGNWVTTAEVNTVGGKFYHCNSPNAAGQYSGTNSNWHGTQTASLIGAATDNSTGMASVGRDVMVLPVRVLGKCFGYDSDIVPAMYWAAGLPIPGDTTTPTNPHPARVISMSLGSTGACPASYSAVFPALAAAKVAVVVSAGNATGLAVSAPANCSGAIAVAGVRHVGSKVGYSNIGPEVTVAAPAGNCVNTATGSPCLYPIITARNNGTTTPTSSGYSDGNLATAGLGTSFASPLVAGTVGLMLSVDPTLTPAKIKALLQSTARPFPTTGAGNNTDGTPVTACKAPSATIQDQCYCTTSTCGAGLLDVGAAVAAAVPAVVVAPPSATITASNSTPTAGLSVTLTATNVTASGGRSIAAYQWGITSGSGFAAFSGSTTGSSATLVTNAEGAVVVSLTVTDSAGATGTASTSVSVQAAPVVSTGTGSTSSGGGVGGGGAMSGVWVALLGLAAWTLRRDAIKVRPGRP